MEGMCVMEGHPQEGCGALGAGELGLGHWPGQSVPGF